ncbi:MAG: acetyl-CoA carboxylase, partial [Chloroflexota bacterium]|nr:acetyl-CoA carboxylase [Chloroflexota bacterium]
MRGVLAAAHASDVTDLEIANGSFRVRLRRAPGEAAPALGDGQPGPPAADETGLHRVAAPFTGVFYRSPTPSARPYVNEGDWVDADAVIGLVETMKIFNEVVADCSGRIVRFQADNGQLVHAGDPLALIQPG